MRRTDSLEKTLILGKVGSRRRRGWQRVRWLDGITDLRVWASSRCWWWTGKPGVLQPMGLQRVRRNWVTKQQKQILPAPPLAVMLWYFVRSTHTPALPPPSIMASRNLDATLAEGHNWMEIKFCHLGDCEFVTEINSSYRLIKMIYLEVLFCGPKLVSTKWLYW